MIYLDRKEKKPLYQQLYEAIIAEKERQQNEEQS